MPQPPSAAACDEPPRVTASPDPRRVTSDPLLDTLWRACLDGRDDALMAHAEALRDQPAWAPWLAVLRAYRHHMLGESEPRDALWAQAHAEFSARGDVAGLATCRSLDAGRLGRAGRWDEAMARLDDNEALPSEQRHHYERYVTTGRRRHVQWYRESYDEALRESLRLVEAARELGAPAEVVSALALLGGLEADLFNLEDALRHCEEAFALTQTERAEQPSRDSGLARRNLAYTLDALGRPQEALALVDSLADAGKASDVAENECLQYATILLHAGEPERAQAWLDRSVAARAGARGDANAWTATQAELWLARGETLRVRALCEAYFLDSDAALAPSRSPTDTMRIHRACGQACALLGDPVAALLRQEAAFACYETLVGRAARARRITFEMEHSLERERWQREVAEQRQREAELERERLDRVNLALEAAMLAKTRFLAAASHDLRQPVQALMMYSAALKNAADDAARQGLVGRLDSAVGALAAMFDALLDVSRLDAGVVAADLRDLTLLPLLERLADECRSLAAAHRLEVRLVLPRGTAPGVARTRSDPVLLERCLRNLLDNARKYTQRGGIILALRRRRGPAGERWRVEVHDTGIGIKAGDQARVFEEFFQVDAEPQRPDEARGLGLGLSIVSRLAAVLGHPIGLRSRHGRGTCVWIDLPLVVEDDASTGALAPTAHAAWADTELPLTLAVVEDDKAVRTALATLLTQWQHRVLAGADASQVLGAWRAAGRPPLHAIVSDLTLAGPHDGIDAITALRNHMGGDLPALVLTGETNPARLLRLRQHGLPSLTKPVQPARLRSWLRSLARADPAPR